MSYLLTIQTLLCSERNVTYLRLTLNRELCKLFVWFSVNKLSLKLSKTNYILFQNRSADTCLNVCINTINVIRVGPTVIQIPCHYY